MSRFEMNTLNEILKIHSSEKRLEEHLKTYFPHEEISCNFQWSTEIWIGNIIKISREDENSEYIISTDYSAEANLPYMPENPADLFYEEYFAIATFVSSRELLKKEPTVETFNVLYRSVDFDMQFIIEFYNINLILIEKYLEGFGIQTEGKSNFKKSEQVYDIADNLFSYLTLDQVIKLKDYYCSLQIFNLLLAHDYIPHDVDRGLNSIFTKNKYDMGGGIRESYEFGVAEDSDYETITSGLKGYEEVEHVYSLEDYVIFKRKTKFYVIEKEGFLLLSKATDISRSHIFSYDRKIRFYINESYDLIIKSDVFYLKQRAYVRDAIKDLVNREISKARGAIDGINLENIVDRKKIIDEFELLIDDSSKSENELDRFLRSHYKIIFSHKYDEMYSQTIIKELNEKTEQKTRRTDILVRNPARKDIEIIELKKSNVRLTRQIRGIPSLTSVVNAGISQLLYYKDLLSQNQTKVELASKGILCTTPEFTLIVGRELTDDAKKCFAAEYSKGIKIMTYGELLEYVKKQDKN